MSAPAEAAYLRLSFRHRYAGTALRPFHRLGTRKHLHCEIGVSQRCERDCHREQSIAPQRKGLLILVFWPSVGWRTNWRVPRYLSATGAKQPRGRTVLDIATTKRRDRTVACPRCGTMMDEVATIAPTFGEPGLIGYECPNCVYVTSELVRPH
jgi:hypothetical protein